MKIQEAKNMLISNTEKEERRMSGYLKQKHGMTLLGNTPPGTCEMCAVKHDPAQPHNCQSLTYQYKFYDQNGRFPTWKDAMEHCTQEVKDYWTAALAERGIEV